MAKITPATSLAGREIAYAEITSNFAYSTDNNVVDITGLTITFTPVQAAVDVVLGFPYVDGNTTAMAVGVFIADGAGTFYQQMKETLLTGALRMAGGQMKVRLSLTPGTSYTFKGQIIRGLAGASTVTMIAAATSPAWIQAIYR